MNNDDHDKLHPESEREEERPKLKPLTKKELLYLTTLCFSIANEAILYAIIAPFLPLLVSYLSLPSYVIFHNNVFSHRQSRKQCHHSRQGSSWDPLHLVT